MSNKILHENKYSCYKKELILYFNSNIYFEKSIISDIGI